MTSEALRPIRCQSRGKLICEADGTNVIRCSGGKTRNLLVLTRRPALVARFVRALHT